MSHPPSQTDSTSTSRGFRNLVGGFSAIVFLSSVAAWAAAFTLSTTPAWQLLGFEAVSFLAGVIGVLWGFGRLRTGPAMTLMCLGATIVAGAYFANLGALGQIEVAGRDQGISLRPYLLARLAIGVIFLVVSAWITVSRMPSSISLLMRAAVWGAPLAIGGIVWKLKGVSISSALDSWPGWASVGLYGVLGLVGIVCLTVCGHCVLKAFELASEKAIPDGRA